MDIQKSARNSEHRPITRFERALFLSWYCSRGDCAFCYMSTQKNLIQDPKMARRSLESIYAEVIIAKACNWDIEFLSGGYESFEIAELVEIAKRVSEITGKKQWLNLGALSGEELRQFLPYIKGYVGTLECVNPELRKKLCPSKPLSEILSTFRSCDALDLGKAVTVIIGLGETLADFEHLKKFITDNEISRITFYSLNPQKGTKFTESPSIDYYEKWIAQTRTAFPGLHIVAGAWSDKTDYFSRLLIAGADNITKLPAMKIFGSRIAQDIVSEVESARRKFQSNLMVLPKVASKDAEIQKKLEIYLMRMAKNINERQ